MVKKEDSPPYEVTWKDWKWLVPLTLVTGIGMGLIGLLGLNQVMKETERLNMVRFMQGLGNSVAERARTSPPIPYYLVADYANKYHSGLVDEGSRGILN